MSFYVLRNPMGEEATDLAVTEYVPVEPVEHGQPPTCPQCGKYVAVMPWVAPHRAELEVWCGRYGDVAFGPGLELLLSSRFVELYRSAGLSGFGPLKRVEISGVRGPKSPHRRGPLPMYFCGRPVLGNAKIDARASGMELEEPYVCDECRSAHILRFGRVVLEEGTWSGEDVFFARGLPGVILSSERFAKWFSGNRINNGMLVLAREYGKDFYPRRGGRNRD